MGIDFALARSSPREFVAEMTRSKFFRYSTASAVAVVVSQVALVTFNAGLGWSGVRANLTSVAIASIPNYTINRYWTWQQNGRNRLWTEIVPFWVMALLGTILSTLAVGYADRQWGTPLSVAIAQLSGFGVLWVARFLILDKLIWRVVHDIHPEADLADTGMVTAGPNGAHGNGNEEAEAGVPALVPIAHSATGSNGTPIADRASLPPQNV